MKHADSITLNLLQDGLIELNGHLRFSASGAPFRRLRAWNGEKSTRRDDIMQIKKSNSHSMFPYRVICREECADRDMLWTLAVKRGKLDISAVVYQSESRGTAYSVSLHPSVVGLRLLDAVLPRFLGERTASSTFAFLPCCPALRTLNTHRTLVGRSYQSDFTQKNKNFKYDMWLRFHLWGCDLS